MISWLKSIDYLEMAMCVEMEMNALAGKMKSLRLSSQVRCQMRCHEAPLERNDIHPPHSPSGYFSVCFGPVYGSSCSRRGGAWSDLDITWKSLPR
jgi:hypothetical protein